MMWDGNGWHDGSWGIGGWSTMIGIVLLAIAMTLLVAYLIRSASVQTEAHAGPASDWSGGPPQAEASAHQANALESAREIVKRRYAAGEIEREEYLQKLADL